jgi:hypothetical protein
MPEENKIPRGNALDVRPELRRRKNARKGVGRDNPKRSRYRSPNPDATAGNEGFPASGKNSGGIKSKGSEHSDAMRNSSKKLGREGVC